MTSEAARKAWATRRKQGWVPNKKRIILPGVIVGFYKDGEGRTRPVTKPKAELKRKKIVLHPKKFKGVAPKPPEWRLKIEIKRLSNIQRDIAKYEEELRGLKKREDVDAVEDLLKMLRSTEARLLWMKKHPFIEAAYDGKGRENYERAIAKGVDYGFDLQNPANSFIHTFHLKKHDIKGLRIYLETKAIKLDLPGEEKTRKHGYTTRAYYKNSVMHLPPTRKDEKPEKVEQTVIHEIGHHIYSMCRALRNWWEKGRPKEYFELQRDKEQRMTGEVKKVQRNPFQVALKASDYLGYFHPIDLFEWRISDILTGGRFEPHMHKEAWAQTFAAYRQGKLKEALKHAKENRDNAFRWVHEAEGKLSEFKKQKEKGELWGDESFIKKQLREKRAYVREAKKNLTMRDATYNNYLVFTNQIKHADSKGWFGY